MIKTLLSIVLASAMATAHAAVRADYAVVVPLPQAVTATKGKPFVLTRDTKIFTIAADKDMQRNAAFLSTYISDLSGITVPVEKGKAGKGSRIDLILDPKAKGIGREGYRIDVRDRQITVTGATAAGVFYGIQTLRKSLSNTTPTDSVLFPAAVITDAPRFGYRGMMLDCSRHFWKVDEVKRILDIMALHNINRFHWHLSDDQGWRFEVPGYPKLTTVGSRRAATVLHRNSELTDLTPYGSYYYTDADIRDIVQYARDRYITIVPEVDMPGHMMAALASYPELGCTGGPYRTGEYWGVYKDILCAGNEKVYSFVKAVLDKVIDLFPESEYIHIGGDESPRDRWEKCPKCQEMIKRQGITAKDGKSKEALLQGYFDRRVQAYLEKKGKKIIGWDELLGCDVDTTATIMSWRGVNPGARAVEMGHEVIMAPVNHCYFDYNQARNHATEPTDCYADLLIEDVYNWNPIPDGATPEVASRIMGVQANVWCEYIALPNVLEYMILPRLAALSEVQWMQQGKRDYNAFKTRVSSLRHIYDHYGWTYAHHLWKDEFRREAREY